MGLGMKLGQLFARLSPPLDTPAHPSPISPSHVLNRPSESEKADENRPSTTCARRHNIKAIKVSRRSKDLPPSFSLDKRRHGSYLATSTTALSRLHASAESFGQFDTGYIYHYLASLGPIPSRFSGAAVDRHFVGWLPHLDHYTAEIIRLEGRGDKSEHKCGRCLQSLVDGAGLRCDDCFDVQLYCKKCCVALHSHLPLHRIQHWTGDHFQPIQLKSLGLYCQLGHVDGERCPSAIHVDSFIVLDVTGLHEISVCFCGCEGAAEHYIQLLRQRWWPATFREPRTVATFQVLNQFDTLCGQSPLPAVSSSDYYNHLVHLTDNVGANPPPNRLFSFEVMLKQWRRVKALKHAGVLHGFDLASISPCVVGCPACPRSPGENIPGRLSSGSWRERLRSAISGHVVPKCCKVTNEDAQTTNPQLGEQHDGNLHVRVVTCRHGLKHARIVDGALDCHDDSFPDALHATNGHDLTRNSTTHYNPRRWRFAEAVDVETRCDELDGIFRTWNWYQVMTLPTTLLQRAKEILPQHNHCCQMYDALNQCIPSEFTKEWSRTVAQWNKMPGSLPSPYAVKYSHLSEMEVRQELRHQDVIALEDRGRVYEHGLTINEIIVRGLGLEDEQRKLRADVADFALNPAGVQEADLRQQQDVLRRRIIAWHDAEQKLIPALVSLRADGTNADPSPQTTPLLLPSAICSRIGFSEAFLTCEWRLREAQAYDALGGLRGYLEVIAYILGRNDVGDDTDDAGGQNDVIVAFAHSEINKLVVRYRDAYAALVNLAAPLGDAGWRRCLRELADTDVRFITELDGDGRRPWIWNFGGTLYLKPEDLHDIAKNKNLRDALRVMWCNAHARALESSAERDFLLAEMDRSAIFHDDQGKWWEGRVNRSFPGQPQYLEGANAYAYRQASIRRAMEMHCKTLANIMRYWFSGGQIPARHPSPDFGELPGSVVSLVSGGGMSQDMDCDRKNNTWGTY